MGFFDYLKFPALNGNLADTTRLIKPEDTNAGYTFSAFAHHQWQGHLIKNDTKDVRRIRQIIQRWRH